MNKMEPTISVLVAVYNGASTVERCINSVTSQTYARTELVVIDGGSTDGTKNILECHAADLHYWVSEKDNGIYDAWNKALARCTGDWICFIGADDYLWSSDVVERLVPKLVAADADVVYGSVSIVSKTGDLIRTEGVPWEQARVSFTQAMSIPHPGLLHRKELFEKHGNFDDSFKIAGDWDFLLRVLPHGKALFVPDVTTVGFQHGGISNTPAAMGRMLKEFALVRRKHGLREGMARFSSVRIKMTICALVVSLIGERGFRELADTARKLTGRPSVWK